MEQKKRARIEIQPAGVVSAKTLVAEYGPGTMGFATPHGPVIERPVKWFRQYSDNTIEWEFADD